jgi:hypothetical protein
MSDLEQLKLDLPRMRTLARTVDPDAIYAWSPAERINFDRELRWCVEALQELAVRVKAASPAA